MAAIPDNGTFTTSVFVADAATVNDVNLTIDITHTFDQDLTITLQSPTGTIAALCTNRGSTGDNFSDTVFDDGAGVFIGAGVAPFTGSFRPEQALGVFDGECAHGTWTLRVRDTMASDTGTLNSWSLQVCTGAGPAHDTCTAGLQVDNGVQASGIVFGQNNLIISLLNHFTGIDFPSRLDGLCIMMGGFGTVHEFTFDVLVYNEVGGLPGTLVAKVPGLVAKDVVNTDGFYSFDLSAANVVLNASTAFVGITFNSTGAEGVGYATDSEVPLAPKSFMAYGPERSSWIPLLGVSDQNLVAIIRASNTAISAQDGIESADQNGDFVISLGELLRVIQFYNSGGLYCADTPSDTEDGYVPGTGANHGCLPYDSDYTPQDWIISLSELLRVIQLYNSLAYHYCPADGTEDGFCPGP